MDNDRPIIFFDGLCNLCNSSADHIIKNDKNFKFYISSLQGQTAQKLLKESDLNNLNTLILKDGPHLYYKSAAIFRIAFKLKGLYCLLWPFWMVPRFLTDWIYDFMAYHRYKWFGKRTTCRIPTKEEEKHFLD